MLNTLIGRPQTDAVFVLVQKTSAAEVQVCSAVLCRSCAAFEIVEPVKIVDPVIGTERCGVRGNVSWQQPAIVIAHPNYERQQFFDG